MLANYNNVNDGSTFLNYLEKREEQIALPLSSGYDSNLLLSLMLKSKNKLNLFSVGVKQGVSEINTVQRIAESYNLNCDFSYVNSEMLLELPEIAEILQGTVFEPGVFLYHSLSKNISKYNSKIVLCGDGSDQIFHNRFNLRYYEAEEYKFGKDPFLLATTVQVAEWLGHSSSTTTLKFYAHIDKTSKMAIANNLKAG